MKIKNFWTEHDFSDMNWHDSNVHSITFPGVDQQLILDIDYIFDSELEIEKNTIKYWVSPCHLIFKNVLNLNISLDFKNFVGIEIISVIRSELRNSPSDKVFISDYKIETDRGIITFESTGYVQEVLVQPIFTNNSLLSR